MKSDRDTIPVRLVVWSGTACAFLSATRVLELLRFDGPDFSALLLAEVTFRILLVLTFAVGLSGFVGRLQWSRSVLLVGLLAAGGLELPMLVLSFETSAAPLWLAIGLRAAIFAAVVAGIAALFSESVGNRMNKE